MKLLMKMLGWMLSNLALIGLVVVASYVFVYWDDPIGKETPAGKLMAWFPQSGEEERSDPQSAATPPETDSMLESRQNADRSSSEQTQAWMSDDSPANLATTSEPDRIDQALDQVIEEAVDANLESLQAEPAFSPRLSETAPAVRAEQDTDQSRRMIVDARLAYHRGDQEAAIATYEALVRQQPGHFDALGELGNIHYLRRDWPRAADAWYRSALAMLEQGHRMRANDMVSLLRPIDGQRAYQLDRRLMAMDATPQMMQR